MNSPKRVGADPRQGIDPENLNYSDKYKVSELSDKQAVKLLYSLIEADNVRKYPNNPYPLRAKPYNLKKTGDLTKAVIKWIQLNGGQAERISSTGRYIDNSFKSTNVLSQTVKIGSGKWIPGASTNGSADVSATINGRSVKFEIKNVITQDRQSEAQKQYQKAIENSGGIYIIVTSFSMFLEFYYKQNFGGQPNE